MTLIYIKGENIMKIENAIVRKVEICEDNFGDKAVELDINYGVVLGSTCCFSVESDKKRKILRKSMPEFELQKEWLRKLMEYSNVKDARNLKGKKFRVLLSGKGGLGSIILGFGHPTDNDFFMIRLPDCFKEVGW